MIRNHVIRCFSSIAQECAEKAKAAEKIHYISMRTRETTELSLKTIIAVNQLSLCEAVVKRCDSKGTPEPVEDMSHETYDLPPWHMTNLTKHETPDLTETVRRNRLHHVESGDRLREKQHWHKYVSKQV